MRRKNIKLTYIYWLIDIRPETIAAGWLQGLLFYCGKTVRTPEKRFAEHKQFARRGDRGSTYDRLRECGEYVRMVVMETVPPENNWVLREQHWIAFSRRMYPEAMTNITAGGQGAPGVIQTTESIEKRAAAMRGRKLSPETCARMGAARRGKKRSPETVAKIAAANRGKKRSPGEIERLVATNRGRKHTLEACANMGASRMGKKRSLETCAKISAAKVGKKLSSEHCAALRSGWARRAADRADGPNSTS